MLAEKKYTELWNTKTSKFYKKNITKDSFLANMSIGRSQLGVLTGSNIVDVQYSERDELTNYDGKIYSITFLSEYTVGNFYERIVVTKETDGIYRLGGLWGAPAPTQ